MLRLPDVASRRMADTMQHCVIFNLHYAECHIKGKCPSRHAQHTQETRSLTSTTNIICKVSLNHKFNFIKHIVLRHIELFVAERNAFGSSPAQHIKYVHLRSHSTSCAQVYVLLQSSPFLTDHVEYAYLRISKKIIFWETQTAINSISRAMDDKRQREYLQQDANPYAIVLNDPCDNRPSMDTGGHFHEFADHIFIPPGTTQPRIKTGCFGQIFINQMRQMVNLGLQPQLTVLPKFIQHGQQGLASLTRMRA